MEKYTTLKVGGVASWNKGLTTGFAGSTVKGTEIKKGSRNSHQRNYNINRETKWKYIYVLP